MLKQTVKAAIWRDEPPWYVAECHEIAVVTQGSTLDKVTANLHETIDYYFEGEDRDKFGFFEKPTHAFDFGKFELYSKIIGLYEIYRVATSKCSPLFCILMKPLT